MMQLVGQLEAAQQQLQQQLREPGAGDVRIPQNHSTSFRASQPLTRCGGLGQAGEVGRLRKQLADEAEDNDELSKQIVALDRDHQKLTEQAATLTEENRVFREENERLLKANAALKARSSAAESGQSEGQHDVHTLTAQLEDAGTRLEEGLEEKENFEIKCKELELQVTTLEETLSTGGQLVVESSGAAGSAEVAHMKKALAIAEQEKERLVDEVEEKEIRNTELLIEIETLEEEILQLDDRLLAQSR